MFWKVLIVIQFNFDVISSASASENSSPLLHSENEIIKFEGKVLKKVTFRPTGSL